MAINQSFFGTQSNPQNKCWYNFVSKLFILQFLTHTSILFIIKKIYIMKNLQSLLTEKGMNVLVSQQMLMVKGGKGRNKNSNKSHGSNESHGTKKGGTTTMPPAGGGGTTSPFTP